MTFSSDRTVITSTNNTLSSKSAIIKVGDTIYKEEEWPIVADLDGRQWSTVVANGNKNSKTRQVPQQNFNAEKIKTWRKKLNLLHGTALGNSEGESTLSADVDLVAYGIAKRVTSIQLSKFLEEKGLDVCDCKLLTTFERARTLSFKIIIEPHHFEKAKDPSIWPYRVGVRLFKYFNANNRNKNNPGKSVRFTQDLQVISR